MAWIRRAVSLVVMVTTPYVWALDLSQAFEAALSQDANIRAARATAKAGQEFLPQARAQLLPNVSITATRNKNKLDSSTPNSFGVMQDSQSDYFSQSHTLSVRQPLLNEAKHADYAQAAFKVADADALLERETLTLAARVSESYFLTLLAQDQLALLLVQETTTRIQLDAAQRTFAAGSGTRTDIDEMQASLDMNAALLLEARQNLEYAREQLGLLINQPVTQLAPVNASCAVGLSALPRSLEDWQAQADQNSPEIKMMQARHGGAEVLVQKARAGHWPTLDAVAQWSRSDSDNVTRLNSSYTTGSIGLQLSVPLYAGGYVNSTVRQALAEQDAGAQALEATRRDLRGRVHKEFRGITDGVLRIKALEQAVRSADQMLLSSRKSALAGARTQLDVQKSLSQLAQAGRDLSQSRYMVLLARVRLTALSGLPAQASLDEVNRCLVH